MQEQLPRCLYRTENRPCGPFHEQNSNYSVHLEKVVLELICFENEKLDNSAIEDIPRDDDTEMNLFKYDTRLFICSVVKVKMFC